MTKFEKRVQDVEDQLKASKKTKSKTMGKIDKDKTKVAGQLTGATETTETTETTDSTEIYETTETTETPETTETTGTTGTTETTETAIP